MSSRRSRREFIRSATFAGVTIIASERAWAGLGRSANSRIAFGCIGVGGKGDSDTSDAAQNGDVVAICDIDDTTLAAAAAKYPDAKKYNDYRKMLDEMGRSIDAVTVSTPDHQHGPAAAMAMSMGKHCYCQKPLTHTIWEARRLGEIARRQKVATQMGNQGTAGNSMRHNAYAVRQGVLGTVKEVHVWTNRPIWPQGVDRPDPMTPPENVHWDLWLGPAPERPYSDAYHPFKWRGWWDFGTGALGDMACHTVNLPYMALGLRDPVSVIAETSGTNKDSYPSWSVIKFEFPATRHRAAVTMTWYDGGKKPSPDLMTGASFEGSGSLIIGDKGKLYTPGDYGGGGRFVDVTPPENVGFPRSPGHWEEFVGAILGGEQAMSNFTEYAGPLTETILLGNLAVWAGGQLIEWDPKKLRPTNAPDAEMLVRPRFRGKYRV